MPVVFRPYLDRVTTTDSDSPESDATTGGLSTRRAPRVATPARRTRPDSALTASGVPTH